MAWQGRVREAAYTPPSGNRLVFSYENVSKTITKKGTAFNFPDADGTLIQGLGHTGRRYPMRIFFWGDDYDLEAKAFEDALLERGTGELEHPVYGVVNVVPLGEIKQRDDLKTASNQAILEVQFWDTIDLLFPTGQTDPADSVLSAVDDYNGAIAEQSEELLDIDTASEQISFKNKFQTALDVAQSALQTVADTQDDVKNLFNTVFDSINAGIDVLVAQPLALISQTTILLQAPALALTNIEAKLDAYGNLATSLITGDDAIQTPGLGSDNANAFHTADVFASTAVTGTIVSVINNQFTTKHEALAAAEAILNLSGQVAEWRDNNFESLGVIDTGEAYQQLEKAVALTAGFLVQISFSLKQERRIVLTRPHGIVDLVFELYGPGIDEQLDFFINSNDLTGDEIIELPKGREIVYFI